MSYKPTSEFATKTGSKDIDAGQSLMDALMRVKTPHGSISFEKRANALVVRDTPNALDQMQNIIDKLDVPPKQRAELASPQVSGKWMGTWESAGHKGHGGGLNCDAIEAGPQKWAATFTATYGPTKSYQVKLEGKLVDGAVLFGGTVDLGKADGGNFTWTGKATATAFTGKYEGGGDTGTFAMVRAPENK